jgi:hypothetical protein
MGTSLEREGLSKLDERLNQFEESDGIILSPPIAREILIAALLDYLKRKEGEFPESIEALVKIAQEPDDLVLFNYNQTLEAVTMKRRETENRKMGLEPVIITPPKPKQQEF